MKKWSLILLLWYIFVDNTPWIQEAEKKTVWILKPSWSTEKDCWDVKVKLYERFKRYGDEQRYLCVDMNFHNPPPPVLTPEQIVGEVRDQLIELIKILRLQMKKEDTP